MELSDGLEGRSSNPVSLLFDSLFRPNTDIGETHPSSLSWSYDSSRVCSHIVLGKGKPGGSWHNMPPLMQTLNSCEWLELPLYPFARWKRENSPSDEVAPPGVEGVDSRRALAGDVARYYEDYVAKMCLENNFLSDTTVKSVKEIEQNRLFTNKKFCDYFQDRGICLDLFEEQKSFKWLVHAQNKDKGITFRAKNLVLACGFNESMKLGVAGEELPFVLYSLAELDVKIPRFISSGRPAVVVGAGMSAADAILTLMSRGIPVCHVFRQEASSNLLFSKLPQVAYKEYHKVWNMMKGVDCSNLYTPFEQHELSSFHEDGSCSIASTIDNRTTTLEISVGVVMIGSQAGLHFLPKTLLTSLASKDGPIHKNNLVEADSFSFKSEASSRLYALGPLVGDNFVRFLFGSCVGAAQSILRLAPPHQRT